MTVQFTSITKNADRSWRFEWSGTGTWRVVLYGVELTTTTGNFYTWTGPGFTAFPPPVEVVPQGETSLTERFKPYVLIQWYRDDGAARYLVQRSPDGSSSWATVATVQEAGLWVYSYRSPVLDDGTHAYWQVIAESPIGNQSMARKFDALIVTPPRPVDASVEVGYSAGEVVVTEA